MADLLWLPAALTSAGLDVILLPGWQSRRTRAGFNPQGVVCHHTASSRRSSDENVAQLLARGHSTLKGPLSQLGLDRSGRYWVIAAGRCNHNGYGQWGNDSIGIEAFNDGRGEPWPEAQMDAYASGVAAILAHYGWSVDRCKGHKETDPRRKIDPTFDMGAFRARVRGLPADPIPPEPIAQLSEEDTMLIGYSGSLFVLTNGKLLHVAGPEDLAAFQEANPDAKPWHQSRDQWRRTVATYGRPLSETPGKEYQFVDAWLSG